VRAAYLAFYGAFAALGAALLAPPALLSLKGLGLWRPALPWEVPLGAVAAGLLFALGALAVRFAVATALGDKPHLLEHAVFLALVAGAVALRTLAADPTPPKDPAPALLQALRTAADATDSQYAARKSYALDEAALSASLAKLPAPAFVWRGRALPLRARLLPRAAGPQLAPEADDLPGTVLIAISPDQARAWLTVLTLREGRAAVLTSDDRPVQIHARAGTHGAPGRDPLVPAYPSMRAVGERRR
jgi:hypothetical protein